MASIKQKILHAFYPVLMKAGTWLGFRSTIQQRNEQHFQNPIPDLQVMLNNGNVLQLRSLRGKKILIVNTASHCGYTAQYAELQQLQTRYGQALQVIGFPSNDFKNQEPESDAAIAQFCQLQFGVTFPLAQKSHVMKTGTQHPVYQWLTHKAQNGWNDKAPSWNFSKYLLNEAGSLTHYFDPSVSPLSNDVTSAVAE